MTHMSSYPGESSRDVCSYYFGEGKHERTTSKEFSWRKGGKKMEAGTTDKEDKKAKGGWWVGL